MAGVGNGFCLTRINRFKDGVDELDPGNRYASRCEQSERGVAADELYREVLPAIPAIGKAERLEPRMDANGRESEKAAG